MSNEVASGLQTASEIFDMAAAAPGPIGIAAKIASLALKAGAAIAAAGGDPVMEIARALSPKKEVKGVHGEWGDFVTRNFPPASQPPDSFEKHKTDPSMSAVTDDDPYPEDD
jgi:hypothetical protein